MRRKSALELRRKKTTCCNFGGSNEKPETCPLEFHHRGAVSLCCALKSIALYAQSNPPSILTDSRQIIVLVTPHWNAVNGTLRRYPRENAADVWQPMGGSFPVVIGAKGMAWGAGFQRGQNPKLKMEGDKRTPAGIYAVSPAFGFEPDFGQNLKMPYVALAATHVGVDNAASNDYNQLVDRAQIQHPDWKSGDRMREIPQYRLGSVIQYNTESPDKKAGSCMFMHVWKTPETGTAGCIAMEEAKVKETLHWLDASLKP